MIHRTIGTLIINSNNQHSFSSNAMLWMAVTIFSMEMVAVIMNAAKGWVRL